jgi:hypothetical protein
MIICLYLSILSQWHREVLPRVSVPHLFSQAASHEFKYLYGFRDADRECRGDETEMDVTGDNRHVLTQDRDERIAHGVFSVRSPNAFSQWITASEQ